MSLKRDVQATQPHKVKLCVLESSRERVCIRPTSLLTDSWQLSVLSKAKAETQQTHAKKQPVPCAQKSSPDTFQTNKSTHMGKNETM